MNEKNHREFRSSQLQELLSELFMVIVGHIVKQRHAVDSVLLLAAVFYGARVRKRARIRWIRSSQLQELLLRAVGGGEEVEADHGDRIWQCACFVRDPSFSFCEMILYIIDRIILLKCPLPPPNPAQKELIRLPYHRYVIRQAFILHSLSLRVISFGAFFWRSFEKIVCKGMLHSFLSSSSGGEET